MAVRKFNPVTPGTRFRIINAFTEITTSTPEKSLLKPSKKSGGRNSDGHRAMRYIGGGHKQMYRIIDFKRDKHNIPGQVTTIEYDPNRSAFISLISYKDGEKRYILAPAGLKVGQTIMSGTEAPPEIGNALYLKDIPLGTIIHNVELHPGKGGAMVRSAGANAQLSAKEGKYAIIKLPSGENRMVLANCMATIGSASNSDHNTEMAGKAGRNRWKGIRPRNRGVAMNPVDHPMGGGEGKASGGHPRSRNGKYAKGMKTRHPKNVSNKFIISRKKK
ncbi:MAG: 50S ribosomal protein L2 [Chitinophagales bacterium]|jgi:large subunit ribosomal protein L2|nr:50S ribosomal protein L2 [Chitinophagales bacterium]